MDELKYLEAALTANAHIYATYMSRESQDSLSLYLANAPPKVWFNYWTSIVFELI